MDRTRTSMEGRLGLDRLDESHVPEVLTGVQPEESGLSLVYPIISCVTLSNY